MKESCTAQELSKILKISDRTIRWKTQQGKLPCDEQPNPHGGGVIRLYSVNDLPEEWRKKIMEYWMEMELPSGRNLPVPTAKISVKGMPAGVDNETDSGSLQNESLPAPSAPVTILTNRAPVKAGLPVRAGQGSLPVPEKSDKIGLAKYSLVMAWRDLLASESGGKRGDTTRAFLLAYKSGRTLPDVRKLLGDVSVQTLYRLDKQLREGNGDYKAIADGRGGWRKHGSTKWKGSILSVPAQEELLSCWLLPEQPTVSMAIRAARINLKHRGLEESADDATWRRWLAEFGKKNDDLVVLRREGEKARNDKVGPYISRDTSILVPGQVLVADGHDLNFDILHPVTGKPTRLKLIMFLDWASRMPVGWQIMPTENTAAISAALRNAILTLGKTPNIVYLDNGRAFKSKFFTETDPDLSMLVGIYARLGIALMFARPYNARSKPVERFFGTLGSQFERLVWSFCGSSIEDKPAWRNRNEKYHKSEHEKRTGNYVPNIREAAHAIALFFEWYGRQPHDGLDGRRPAEVLASGLGSGVDTAALNWEFLWRKKIRPRRCRVTLYGIDYESDCLYGLKDDVVVCYDTSQWQRIYIYTTDGAYLGDAQPVAALNPIARILGDQIGLMEVKKENERQRRLAKQTRQNFEDMGLSTDQADKLTEALPFRQKVAIIPGGKTEEAPKQLEAPMSPEERERLEALGNQRAEEIEARQNQPPLERPSVFHRELDRYDWCWRAIYEHKARIGAEDMEWMRNFEQEPKFAEYAGRYRALAKLYVGEEK
jgi:putative transposase